MRPHSVTQAPDPSPKDRYNQRTTFIAVAVTLAAAITLLAMGPSGHSIQPVPDPGPASPALLHALAIAAAEPAGTVPIAASRLSVVSHTPILRGAHGLPRVFYLGANFCPFCASERWPLIVALDRFGSFQGLRLSTSAADDAYPNTPTFTFHGATYRSVYINFTPVETRTNTKVNGTYAPLEHLSGTDAALARTYDAPPYVPPYLASGIPFIDIANEFVATGGSYNPKILRGKSWEDISLQLSDPTTLVARAILAEANGLTAAICTVTENTPAAVCKTPMIRLLEQRLAAHTP